MPAWCDRVLWIGDNVIQSFYRRSELTASDHKPVSAGFDVIARTTVEALRERVRNSLARQLDAWDNQRISQIAVEPEGELVLPDVPFDVPVARSFKVHNVGQTEARFQILSAPARDQENREWLNVSPQTGMLQPGQTAGVCLKDVAHKQEGKDCSNFQQYHAGCSAYHRLILAVLCESHGLCRLA